MILLDTHVLLWWASGNTAELSASAHQAIEAELAGGRIWVSSISAWELAQLVARDRIALATEIDTWLAIAGEIEAVRFVPVDNEIAVKSVQLPGDFHKDPADRIIVATARKLGVPLVTADEKIRAYPHVKALW